jgi:hypothetical protein
MVRDDINFFRNDINGQVLRDKAPELIFKSIRAMRTITVVPDGTVRAHNAHPVNKRCQDSPPMQVVHQEQNEKDGQVSHFQPVEKGQPVLSVLKNV